MMFRCLTAALLFSLLSCIPPGEESSEGVVINLNDPGSRKIYDLQNARATDSLLVYLSHPDPSYRYLAATALASFPELKEAAIDSLAAGLKDREPLVRSAAAYALGQTGEARVAQLLTEAFDQGGEALDFNASVLSALGKTGEAGQQEQLAGITTYLPTDTLLNLGRAWGLYYFGRRGITSKEGQQYLADLLLDPATPSATIIPAAYYFQRFAAELTEEEEEDFRSLLRSSPDPYRRMAAARTIGKNGLPAGRVALLRSLDSESDWRVRVEIIRALSGYDYASVREPLVEALADDHQLVARAAADFFVASGTPADATFYRQLARDSLPVSIRYQLYQAANKHLPRSLEDYRGRIAYDLQRAYERERGTGVNRVAILNAMGAYPWYYRLIHDYYPQTGDPVVRSGLAEVLAGISGRDDFDAFFRRSSIRVRSDLASYFQEMITSREVGPAYFAATALTEDAEVYKRFFPDLSWMDEALSGFSLPKEIETYRVVADARTALAGTPAPASAPKNTAKPINWSIIEDSGNKEVQFRTPAGRFTIELYPEHAPATVSSFLELVQSGYYDGKVFHRIVPNFVAQGGGPLGNGFGSEDFMIRTETPALHWDRAGLIGMASAGKDTEGVQFFLTHQPTPHLDGNYTIFGAITEGQEVVDELLPGTLIESIEIR